MSQIVKNFQPLLLAENRFYDQVIPDLSGKEKIIQANDVFYLIDSNFSTIFSPQILTLSQSLASFEIKRSFMTSELFQSLDESAWLTESQVVFYCRNFRHFLASSHWGTFFPLRLANRAVNGNVTLAGVYAHKKGLAIYRHKPINMVWEADFGFRLIRGMIY